MAVTLGLRACAEPGGWFRCVLSRADRILPKTSRASQRGLTLIEVLIVVVLIALLSGTILFGPGMLEASRMRAAETLIVSSVRQGLTVANSSGRPTRLAFDFDKESITLEQANTSVVVRGKSKDAVDGIEPADEREKKARAESDRILEGPHPPKPNFHAIAGLGTATGAGQARELGKGVEFISVQTDHDEDPRTSGRAYLYFFPGGATERASIQLKRQGDEGGVTVAVSALTGRAKILSGRVDLKPLRDDEDSGEQTVE
ncbi:MAG TPA: prepilin-type N-terminal cleavage/methylation domain-containing protein [Polyangiaceae bacterium]